MTRKASVVHLEVHHVDEEGGGEDEHLGGEVDVLLVVDHEVVRVRQSLLEAAHPLLGYRCHLASLDILGMEEDIITGHKVTRRASDLQNLVPNAVKDMINRIPPGGPLPYSSYCFSVHTDR